MPYHQLFSHLVWATKDRLPLLTPDVKPIVYDLLRSKAIGLGATVFAIGGMEEHVHMVASIPPVIAVSKFIGQTKGATSTRFNKGGHGTVLFWQDEYAAFTFDAKRLPNYVAYVQRQRDPGSSCSAASAARQGASVVAVAQRLPERVVQDDADPLMYCDNALMRLESTPGHAHQL